MLSCGCDRCQVKNVLERPKLIFNDKTKQYVMWMHMDVANYSKASVGLAFSPTSEGLLLIFVVADLMAMKAEI
ncbi:hypothetical protein GOP47_0023916 [Adiantum capillus-veneris]|uniref:Uncharacterized protein n=1 Tax=Adiantum capillus-veneris TaxID=13818 RepID=A0A9D4U6X8_ADICA|nr:hypothetical protein GOP47_0023916 [Adiantum capillus-veneris]